MKKLRVLLVDDEIMIREGFKRLFEWETHDCEVVGEAAAGRRSPPPRRSGPSPP